MVKENKKWIYLINLQQDVIFEEMDLEKGKVSLVEGEEAKILKNVPMKVLVKEKERVGVKVNRAKNKRRIKNGFI